MKSFSYILAAGLVLCGTAATVTAQTPPVLLSTLEVQRLASQETPESHAALASHFAALADRYAAEAKQHAAMVLAFDANPNRRGASTNWHCDRLAALNTQSATTARELAAHHAQLAAGAPSALPVNAAPFERGKGAPEPGDRALTALAASASTPADHRALNEYFVTLAKRDTAEADEHAAMALASRGTRIAWMAGHCDRLVTLSRDSAREATAMATLHEDLAGVGR